MVSDGLEVGNMQIQDMAAEVWSSIFCMRKLFLHWPCFLVSSAWGSGLQSGEALIGMLAGCLFEEVVFTLKLL